MEEGGISPPEFLLDYWSQASDAVCHLAVPACRVISVSPFEAVVSGHDRAAGSVFFEDDSHLTGRWHRPKLLFVSLVAFRGNQ